MVEVPETGEWLVRYGKVLKVIETDSRGNQWGDSDEWVVYTELETEEEEEDDLDDEVVERKPPGICGPDGWT